MARFVDFGFGRIRGYSGCDGALLPVTMEFVRLGEEVAWRGRYEYHVV